jgi:hypothetical protein
MVSHIINTDFSPMMHQFNATFSSFALCFSGSSGQEKQGYLLQEIRDIQEQMQLTGWLDEERVERLRQMIDDLAAHINREPPTNQPPKQQFHSQCFILFKFF